MQLLDDHGRNNPSFITDYQILSRAMKPSFVVIVFWMYNLMLLQTRSNCAGPVEHLHKQLGRYGRLLEINIQPYGTKQVKETEQRLQYHSCNEKAFLANENIFGHSAQWDTE